ncbi:hypothetical protein PTUN_a1270 [Pseudoalteromonas tunicata]|nr:hypothetical protein PTUN_a1270 [Pseudoalteromonas tunicata]
MLSNVNVYMSSLPHRQLRNWKLGKTRVVFSSLPHRQLRNKKSFS